MRLFAPAIALVLLAVAGCGRAEAPKAPDESPTADRAWVELTDRGAEARLVTASATCPAASIDGKLAPMTKRAGPRAEFALTVCQLSLPKDARHASVRGIALPLQLAAPVAELDCPAARRAGWRHDIGRSGGQQCLDEGIDPR